MEKKNGQFGKGKTVTIVLVAAIIWDANWSQQGFATFSAGSRAESRQEECSFSNGEKHRHWVPEIYF